MRNRRALTATVIGSLLGFVLLVALEHVLESQLNPLRHEVSEYARTGTAPVMIAAFALWAVSLAGTAALCIPEQKMIAGGFTLAAAGMVIVACFHTQTSAGMLPPGAHLTAVGRLHDIGSGLTTGALALTAAGSTLRFRALTYRTATAVILAFALTANLALLAVGPSVGGLRQRVLVLAACVWQLLLIRRLRRQQSEGGLGLNRRQQIPHPPAS